MLDHLRQIAIFARTAELGSFRQAADAFRLSPSVVSYHISTLEQQLNVALFYRSTRKLSLTSDGEKLLASAQMMVNSAEDFIGILSNESSRLIGQLKVTLPAFMANSQLVNRIANFSKENPSVKLILDFSDTPRDIVQDGIDLAIRMRPPRDSALKSRKLSDIDRVLVASASYFDSRPIPKTPKDLIDLNWVELSPVGINYVFSNSKDKKVTVRAKSQLLVNNAYALLQSVKNGNGLGVLPSFLVQSYIENRDIQVILKDWKTIPIETYAIWPGNAPKNGITSRLARIVGNQV
jgi:DNA-binding transcriptional LysR family regulator